MTSVFVSILKSELEQLNKHQQDTVVKFLNQVSDNTKRLNVKFSKILINLSVDSEHSATNTDEQLIVVRKFVSDYISNLVDYTEMFKKKLHCSNKLVLQYCVQMLWDMYNIQVLTNTYPITFDELIQEWNTNAPIGIPKFTSNMSLSLSGIIDSVKSSDLLVLIIEKEWNSYIIL